MITIAYSTRETNPELQEYFRKSSGVHNSQIIEVVNPDGKSLTEVYKLVVLNYLRVECGGKTEQK